MRKGSKNSRTALLWQVEFEHNSGSEYEHSERRWFWATTLNNANIAVVKWLHENGYKFSKEERAYSSLANDNFNQDFVRFSVEQATLLHIENGSSLNLLAVGFMVDYEKHSNGFFERK